MGPLYCPYTCYIFLVHASFHSSKLLVHTVFSLRLSILSPLPHFQPRALLPVHWEDRSNQKRISKTLWSHLPLSMPIYTVCLFPYFSVCFCLSPSPPFVLKSLFLLFYLGITPGIISSLLRQRLLWIIPRSIPAHCFIIHLKQNKTKTHTCWPYRPLLSTTLFLWESRNKWWN